MPYAPLQGGNSYLGYYKGGLQAQWRPVAETNADLYVDRVFYAFDRSGWTNGRAPKQVTNIAEIVGAAEYILLEQMGSNPQAEPPPQYGVLMELASTASDQALAAGPLTLPDGTTQEAQSNIRGITRGLVR